MHTKTHTHTHTYIYVYLYTHANTHNYSHSSFSLVRLTVELPLLDRHVDQRVLSKNRLRVEVRRKEAGVALRQKKAQRQTD